MNDKVIMPKELTAENGAKAALIGEFQETIELHCSECDFKNGPCDLCDGSGQTLHYVPVRWTTIKEIYKMAVDTLGITPTKKLEAYEEELWGVLVLGCDNVLAAHSFNEAVKQANTINHSMIDFRNSITYLMAQDKENYPVVWAQVSKWSDISEGVHDPENSIWENAVS